jgi:hypothetical protein
MNYAIAFLGAVLLAAMMYWFIRGRNFYRGPVIEAQIVRDEEEESIEKRSKGSEERDADKRFLPMVQFCVCCVSA